MDAYPLSRLIIFDHGPVADAAVRTGVTRVITGIIIGASDLTASNASMRTTLSVVHRQLNYPPSRGVPAHDVAVLVEVVQQRPGCGVRGGG
jgi:hypothetical protein